MTSQKIDEFIGSFKDIYNTTFIHKDIIYLKKSDDIIKDKQLNQELNKSDLEDLMKKLDIKSQEITNFIDSNEGKGKSDEEKDKLYSEAQEIWNS